jgi:hypothetical protein
VLRERFALLKRLHFHLSSPSLGRLRWIGVSRPRTRDW